MGFNYHRAVIVTTSDCRPGGLPDIEKFRAFLPREFQPLVIGPIPSAMNGYVSYVFLPDGSREGWGTSEEGKIHRARFAALFDDLLEDGSTYDHVVGLTYGDDYRREHPEPSAHYMNAYEFRSEACAAGIEVAE